MALIGTDATKPTEVTYKGMFDGLAYMGRLFGAAEDIATEEHPLLNN